jgi:hypothetical protein
MPAYPKTSNTHNFWTVAPKIMKFVLTRSLFQDASLQQKSKNLKIDVWWSDTDQNRFGHTFNPLGVKISLNYEQTFEYTLRM